MRCKEMFFCLAIISPAFGHNFTKYAMILLNRYKQLEKWKGHRLTVYDIL